MWRDKESSGYSRSAIQLLKQRRSESDSNISFYVGSTFDRKERKRRFVDVMVRGVAWIELRVDDDSFNVDRKYIWYERVSTTILLFFSLWGSFRVILVVFLKARTLKRARLGSRAVVRNPGGQTCLGFGGRGGLPLPPQTSNQFGVWVLSHPLFPPVSDFFHFLDLFFIYLFFSFFFFLFLFSFLLFFFGVWVWSGLSPPKTKFGILCDPWCPTCSAVVARTFRHMSQHAQFCHVHCWPHSQCSSKKRNPHQHTCRWRVRSWATARVEPRAIVLPIERSGLLTGGQEARIFGGNVERTGRASLSNFTKWLQLWLHVQRTCSFSVKAMHRTWKVPRNLLLKFGRMCTARICIDSDERHRLSWALWWCHAQAFLWRVAQKQLRKVPILVRSLWTVEQPMNVAVGKGVRSPTAVTCGRLFACCPLSYDGITSSHEGGNWGRAEGVTVLWLCNQLLWRWESLNSPERSTMQSVGEMVLASSVLLFLSSVGSVPSGPRGYAK